MAGADAPQFPWYGTVNGDDLEQGDILLGCPYFVIPPEAVEHPGEHSVQMQTADAIILTQSCDLALRADGQCEATDVILCPLEFKKDLAEHKTFCADAAWEEVRKGRRPFYHVLNQCQLPGLELDFMLVDFHGVFTLGVQLIRKLASGKGNRPRLLPPYREHLSQAFARLFMRIGLPADIPPFGKKK